MVFDRVARVKTFKNLLFLLNVEPREFPEYSFAPNQKGSRARTSETQSTDDVVFNDFINSLEIQIGLHHNAFFPSLLLTHMLQNTCFLKREFLTQIMCDAASVDEQTQQAPSDLSWLDHKRGI